MAEIDLSVGAVEMSDPASEGRYSVLQFVSAWTDNFAYLGHRLAGTGARKANWLPSPAGDFLPILRMCEPEEAVLSGCWVAPLVTRVV